MERVINICIPLLFLATTPFSITYGQQPTVSLDIGTVAGRKETFTDGIQQYYVSEYLGIPYAKPPVGDLRLRKPEPLSYLNSSPYNATYYRPYCVQGSYDPPVPTGTEDEDCLYLNVFVPDTPPDQPTGHAVMVWVHGGGFSTGASDLYHSSILSALGNIIVITVNYRLSFFGFFSTMDSSSSGNFGLFDQALAFQWVHDNIDKFGGDNDRVTIFGESAGAMSVSMQGLYDKNYGRIHRIIAQSGVATTPYLDLKRDRIEGANLLAETLECPVDETYGMVECLRQKPWTLIKDTTIRLAAGSKDLETMSFMPVLDNDFAKTDYRYLHKYQDKIPDQIEFFKSLDFMNGYNKFDGGVIISLLAGGVSDFEPSQEDLVDNFFNMIAGIGSDEPYTEEILRTILHEYTNWSDPYSYSSVRVQLTNYFTDTVYSAPGVEKSQIHLGDGATGSTFNYIFAPVTTARMPWTQSWLPGADHAEELRLLFGMYYEYMADWEKSLGAQMITYWSNFAKTG